MSALRPSPRPGILDIEAYVPGKSAAPGATKVFKLSSNETPLGPSPKAVEAYRKIAGELEMYPDGASTKLREAIGARYGLDPARIVCGNGSDDLLHLVATAYIGAGDEGIFTEHGFLVYRIAILTQGGVPVVVPEKNYTADVDAILAAVTPRTRVVFLANPNNPTGTYLPFEEVKRLHAGLPKNVVMTRTFSKIHGLANLRIGWAYAPAEICDVMHRIRGPFNVNGAAIEAGVASLADTGHLEAAADHNEKWIAWVSDELARLGLTVTPSVANFILIHFPDEPGRTAAEADRFLAGRGLVLRDVKSYGLGNSLRMTIGTEEANRLVVDALAAFLDRPSSRA